MPTKKAPAKSKTTPVADAIGPVPFPLPQVRGVRFGDMQVSPAAQRDFNEAQAAQYAANFKPEAFGFPVVNVRQGVAWIVDGQHRSKAAELVGYSNVPSNDGVLCETYDNLSESQEAELFLSRDTRRKIHPLDKFRIGVTANRPDELDIQGVVHSLGLHVASNYSGVGQSGGIGSVAVLHRLYHKGGRNLLGPTLGVVKDSYGSPGLRGPVIEGAGLLMHRFGHIVDQDRLITRLSQMMGGVTGLLGKAQTVRLQTGSAKSHCVASVMASTYNSYGPKKDGNASGNFPGRLPNWWKSSEYDAA